MKTKSFLNVLLLTIFVFGVSVSCERDSVVINDESENVDSPIILKSTSCTETSFPNLGPSAASTQTGGDLSNPINIGTLDCRTNAPGGYSELQVGTRTYGVYKLRGSSTRYDGTKTRVERFFKTVNRGVSKNSRFTARFVISDLSDENTCIVQAHATGKIVAGLKTGQTASSAVFLLYAKKTSDPNTFALEVHESTTPYTTTTSGARTITFLRNITKGTEYTMAFTTGYTSTQKAYSVIKIGTTSRTLIHKYTTESVYTRYGAYGAADSGDYGAEIRFRDTQLCRTN